MRAFTLRFIDVWLSNYQWARRWAGGHWELWCVDVPVAADIWHRVPLCSKETGRRPGGLCRGTPICEDYTAPPTSG